MTSPANLIVEADGGSRGNPGPAGSGAVVIDADTGEVIMQIAKFIGVATNNVAEYLAVKVGLEGALKINPTARILVRMDSKLVIEQMSGTWKIKHPDMIQLAAELKKIVSGREINWMWIPREENSRADALANRAMDESADSTVSTVSTDSIVSAQHQAVSSPVVEFNQTGPSSMRAPAVVTAPLTTVVLIRHGRTHLTESKRISGGGGENPQLSEAGRLDAQMVAAAVNQIGKSGTWAYLNPVSVIVASPIQRALETASIIANQLGLPVSTNENIVEISFGDWEGATEAEIRQNWPKEFAAWQGSWEAGPPNGESLAEFDERVMKGLFEIVDANPGKTVAVVSHVMPIRGIIRQALDGGVAGYWSPQISPCSISIMRFWGNQAAELVTVNSTAHL